MKRIPAKAEVDRKRLDALVTRLNTLGPRSRARLFREIRVAAPKYLDIMRFTGNVATDRAFQRAFNGFYRCDFF